MQDKLQFIRFPVLLLTLYFVGKLVVGAAGGSYELGIRLFAMVPLTVHLCLAWGALIRALRGGGVKDAMLTGVLISLVAQLLIFMGTFGSYLLGEETAFSNSTALVNETREVSFAEAIGARTVGVLGNSIIGALASLVGWSLGGLIPSQPSVDQTQSQ